MDKVWDKLNENLTCNQYHCDESEGEICDKLGLFGDISEELGLVDDDSSESDSE